MNGDLHAVMDAIDRGWPVHYGDGQYLAIVNDDEYGVVNTITQKYIPLEDCNPVDFYAIVERDELDRFTDNRGCFHQTCPQCDMMIVLWDEDDHHVCTIQNYREG